MNDLNNKRYLCGLAISALLSALFLCASFSVAAQTADIAEPPTKELLKEQQKIQEIAAEEVKTEEIKPQEVKAEEVKTEETKSTEPENEGIVGLASLTAGYASFYAAKFNGRRTANGERFSSKLLTAAHLTLPFGTLLKVLNPTNNQSVIVRVNDRGPYIRGRLLDLSRAAADRLGITRLGVARVEIEVLKP